MTVIFAFWTVLLYFLGAVCIILIGLTFPIWIGPVFLYTALGRSWDWIRGS